MWLKKNKTNHSIYQQKALILKSLLNLTYTYPKEKKLFTHDICIGVWVNAMVTLMETNSKHMFFLSFS